MILNKEKGTRMWGGGSGGSGGGGGSFDPSTLAGYATQSWVEGSYISKAFFNQIFNVVMKTRVLVKNGDTVISDTTTTSTLAPNAEKPADTTTTDTETGYTTYTYYTLDLEVKAGLWTESYVSALGQNSSGGGGGGTTLTEPLASINDAGLGVPTAADAGKAIIWNGTNWVYGSVGTSSIAWNNITNKPTTINGYGITDAKIQNGTIYLGSNSITPLTSFTESDPTVPSWAKAANKPTYSFNEIANKPTTLSGYGITDAYTKTETDNKFLTIAFFRSLFKAYTSTSAEVVPNSGDTTTIASIKAMFGFWTEQYISALGQGSGGGGGGTTLTEPLASINDAGLGVPTAADAGKAIIWNGTNWVYGSVGTSSIAWNNITNKPTTINGYGITDAKIQNGTIYLGSNSITPLTSFTESDPTVPSWAKAANKPTYSFNEITNKPTTLSGYGITDALSSGTTFWGQQASNGVINGNMTNVGSITMSLDLYANNNFAIRVRDYGGTYRNILNLTNDNPSNLDLGWGSATGGSILTRIWGNGIKFFNASGTSLVEIGSTGQLYVTQGTRGVRIGDVVLMYDANSNALRVEHYLGGAANFYATGGVSALGMSAGSGGSIDTLTVTSRLNIGNTDCNLQQDSDGDFHINCNNYLYLGSSLSYIDDGGYMTATGLCAKVNKSTYFIATEDGIDFFSSAAGYRPIRIYYNGSWHTLNMQAAINAGLFS